MHPQAVQTDSADGRNKVKEITEKHSKFILKVGHIKITPSCILKNKKLHGRRPRKAQLLTDTRRQEFINMHIADNNHQRF